MHGWAFGDHLKLLVVRIDSETLAKKVVMETLNAMHNGQTLHFNVAVVSFSWCQSFACKDNRAVTLDHSCLIAYVIDEHQSVWFVTGRMIPFSIIF